MAEFPPPLQSALQQLRDLVDGERYLVGWFAPGQTLQVVAAVGFDAGKLLVSEALSLSLLQECATTGQSRWSDQDAAQDGSLTFLLAGIKSYLCVPVKLPGGVGILYVDDRKLPARFNYTDYTNVLNLARRLVGTKLEPRALPPPPRPQAPPPSVLPLPMAQQVSFFRSLSTFIQAGIPLLHGLAALGQHAETRRLQAFCQQLHRQLLRGNPLSDCCRRSGGFSPMVLHMLACAERSGQLARVLAMLAEYLEETHDRRRRIQQAMIYPTLVLCACLALAVLLPTYVLRDQLRSYAPPLPWPTQALILLGSLVRSPVVWVLAGLALLALPWAGRRLAGSPRLRRLAHQWLLHNPLTGRLYRARQEVSLATALHLQLQAGVPLLEALRGSFRACDSPLLDEQAEELINQVREGEQLTQVLRQAPGVGRPFCQMLKAGEESGHVVHSLEWVARSAKVDFDQSLETAIRLIEPVVMVVMGIVVGVVTLGTLLPSLKMLESLS